MIGVIVKKSEANAACEFFELFKTPWEFYQQHKTYDVVLLTCDPPGDVKAKLLIIYGSEANALDDANDLKLGGMAQAPTLQYTDTVLPIYGHVRTLQGSGSALLTLPATADVVAVLSPIPSGNIIRVGFDLFQEVDYILSHGQPIPQAQLPTLEVHIAMLRDWIVGSGLPVVEIPNHPSGFPFTVCLTHDVDFLRLRDHKCDHTMFGFVYRALYGALINFLKRRISLATLAKSWRAVGLLPGVYLEIVKDYFLQFDAYLAIERDLVSTFFILPFKNLPGVDNTGQIHRSRAARYDINDIQSEIQKLLANGREIALHGIDAWRNTARGQEERERIAKITGKETMGTRAHWLYQCHDSPQYLEEAGFVYDSSTGYNETVGFRCGTAQVFRPLNATTLLELPLHVMDTALFYPDRLGLTEPQAMTLVEQIIHNTHKFGGVLTINWHHRSLGPERFWGTFYEGMLARLKHSQVCFATAHQAVSWFRMRRSVSFHAVLLSHNKLQVRLSSSPDGHPPLLLRIHIPLCLTNEGTNALLRSKKVIDVSFSGDLETSIPL